MLLMEEVEGSGCPGRFEGGVSIGTSDLEYDRFSFERYESLLLNFYP